MKVEQIYTGCLAEAAYYIESNGEAVIIDPLRETKPYLEKTAAAAGLNFISAEEVILRKELGKDVNGYVFVVERPAA